MWRETLNVTATFGLITHQEKMTVRFKTGGDK